MILLSAHTEDDPGCLMALVIVAGILLAVLLELIMKIKAGPL